MFQHESNIIIMMSICLMAGAAGGHSKNMSDIKNVTMITSHVELKLPKNQLNAPFTNND